MLIESVPNYSEGRRPDVVDRLARAVEATEGAYLLDRTSDASHNRSVLTMAGEAPAVERALEATIEVAIDAIDMEQHTGEHPRIGAVAVGARPFLIAWNINLDTGDVDVAKRIARRVRESGGGLPAVQGNGFRIEELDAAQVSMNLLDFETTPMWRVYDEVARFAAEGGVGIRESELIGLAPQAAFDGVADHAGVPRQADPEARFAAAAGYLRLRDPDPMMVLEQRPALASPP